MENEGKTSERKDSREMRMKQEGKPEGEEAVGEQGEGKTESQWRRWVKANVRAEMRKNRVWGGERKRKVNELQDGKVRKINQSEIGGVTKRQTEQNNEEA